ncbi:MAG: hypothetical protein M5U26_17810 [Planctomycetota bacterium]|nr:hypothetical protein [Planctomycetota bacterium]
MSGLRKLQAAWPLVLALLAAGAAARAQETPVATEAREEVWKYEDKGRRDPFTFVKVDTVVKPPTGPTPGVITDQPVIDKIRESARKSYTLAEQAFMNSDSRNAMALADQGLEAINKAKVPLSELPDLQDLQERLFRLRLASERIFQPRGSRDRLPQPEHHRNRRGSQG